MQAGAWEIFAIWMIALIVIGIIMADDRWS